VDQIDMRNWLEKFDCLSYCVRNGNVEMFRLLYNLAKPFMGLGNGVRVNLPGPCIDFVNTILNPTVKTLSIWLEIIDILDYEGDEYSRLFIQYLCDAKFTTATCPFVLWERVMELREQYHHTEANKPPVPWIQNMHQARRYVKIVNGHVGIEVLDLCSGFGELDVFEYLWKYLDGPPFESNRDIYQTLLRAALDEESGKLKGCEYFFEKFVDNCVYGDEDVFWDWGYPPPLSFPAAVHFIEIKKRELALLALATQSESPPTTTTTTTDDSEENLLRKLAQFIHTVIVHQGSLADFLNLQKLCPCNNNTNNNNNNTNNNTNTNTNSCNINITIKTIKSFVRSGNLSFLQFLHKRGYLQPSTLSNINLLDIAARYGHLEMLKWLHQNGLGGCSTVAIDKAAAIGHYNVVGWLLKNRDEGWTKVGLGRACQSGFYRIVELLVRDLTCEGGGKNRDGDVEEVVSMAFTHAAMGFQLKIMKDIEVFARSLIVGGLKCPKYTLGEVCLKSRFDRRGATRETVMKVIEFLVDGYLDCFDMEDLFGNVWYYPDYVVEYLKERETVWCNGVVREVEEPTWDERNLFEAAQMQPWSFREEDL
ncbi:hypothetical protein HDU76_007463, partial [Blyttiomyces sp. JEL0837]